MCVLGLGANDVSYFPFDEIAEALVLALSGLALQNCHSLKTRFHGCSCHTADVGFRSKLPS